MAGIRGSPCKRQTTSRPGGDRDGQIQVRDHLNGIDRGAAAIVALKLDGYSQEETVELLAERSVRAVEGVLHRWRTQYKDHLRGGD